jgi:putative FmdB family regulatory protein
MPLYEYRCRTCDDVFERRRAMSDADTSTECPHGHADTVRLLSMFASAGSATAPAGAGGGCCGGSCGCAR